MWQCGNAAVRQCRKARLALRRARSHSEWFCAGRQCPVPYALCLAKRLPHYRIGKLPHFYTTLSFRFGIFIPLVGFTILTAFALFSSTAAWAAASLAIGTLNGEQLT
jgi:hypothetical protein